MTQWVSIGMMVAGFAVLVAAGWHRWLASRPVRAVTPIAPEDRLAEIRQRFTPAERQRPDEFRAVRAEAEELANQLAQMLDEKAARLERLLAAADERLSKLEGRSTSAAGFVEARPQPGVDPLARQVYELADTGLAPVDIARKLNQLTGKVELILALRQR